MLIAPPHSTPVLATNDTDEIREFIKRYDGDHCRWPLERGALRYRIHALSAGDFDLGWGRAGLRQRIKGAANSAILHLPRGRRHSYFCDGVVAEGSPRTAILIAPGREYVLHREPDEIVSIRLPWDALVRALTVRGNASQLVRRGIFEIPLVGPRGAVLGNLHRALVEAATVAAVPGSDRLVAQVGAQLLDWLADAVAGTRGAPTAPRRGDARVRCVQEWVEARLGSPLGLTEMCEAAGVGRRWLDAAFRAYRGQTPHQFLAERRLASARHRLLTAAPGDKVTRIALDLGFTHLGRFSSVYHQTYGELPSATLFRRFQEG